MSPLKSILVFLFAGVSRIPEESRAEALLTTFAGVLPEMTLEEIAAAREQVIGRFLATPALAEPILDLIDGHVALRALTSVDDSERPTGSPDGADFEV